MTSFHTKPWVIQLVRFQDKTRGGDLAARSPPPSNTLIPVPNKNLLDVASLASIAFPLFSLSCSFNGNALCSGRNNPYWERPEPNTIGRPSPIEPLSTTVADQTRRQRPTGLQQGEGSNVWHRDPTWQRCVWSQSTPLFITVWERDCFLFTRGRAEALQEMAFLYDLLISKTTCWKWCIVIAILTQLPSHLSVLHSCCISATTAFIFFLFLNVEPNGSGQVRNIYEASKYKTCFLRLKQHKEKVNGLAHYSKGR